MVKENPTFHCKCKTQKETKAWFRHFFKSEIFHIGFAILIILDLIIILTDLFLTMIYCGNDMPHSVEHARHILVIITISILITFLIEILLQIYAFGCQWLCHFLHALDLIVVLITLILEFIFHSNDALQSVFGLIVVFRLWRIVHVVHGI